MFVFFIGVVTFILYITKPEDSTLEVFLKNNYKHSDSFINLLVSKLIVVNCELVDCGVFKVATVNVFGNKLRFIGVIGHWVDITNRTFT
jgi:hypothetical protein